VVSIFDLRRHDEATDRIVGALPRLTIRGFLDTRASPSLEMTFIS